MDSAELIIATSELHYRSQITFLDVPDGNGGVVSLPLYSLLLNEVMLEMLPTRLVEAGRALKMETQHATRRFKIWSCTASHECKVFVEEFLRGEWCVVYRYDA